MAVERGGEDARSRTSDVEPALIEFHAARRELGERAAEIDRRLADRGLVIGDLPAERSAFGGQFLQARFFVEMRAVLVLEIDPRDVVLLTRVADDRKAAARRCDACALKRDLAVEIGRASGRAGVWSYV